MQLAGIRYFAGVLNAKFFPPDTLTIKHNFPASFSALFNNKTDNA